MSEIVVPETPNWLNALEEKREKRLKAKLGHEAGAGAPCLKCLEKCPGLDLHFWRKACKICRCPKEEHDVHDDDIYSWAQFQLLGNKPNKIKTKIVLPGKNTEEVELEWAPKGHKDTIDQYLQSIPAEKLPVKGSKAAQDRKQMLQKQIPIHDIDPSLCHELNEDEMAKMTEYVAHVKKSSVGVGQIVNMANFVKGNLHNLDPIEAMFIAESYAKGVPISEIIKNKSQNSLPLYFDKLKIRDRKNMPNMLPSVLNRTENVYDPSVGLKVRDIPAKSYLNENKADILSSNVSKPLSNECGFENPYFNDRKALNSNNKVPYNDNQNPMINPPKNIRDLVYSTYDPNNSLNLPNLDNKGQYVPTLGGSGRNFDTNSSKLPQMISSNSTQAKESVMVPQNVQIGAIKDLNYVGYENFENSGDFYENYSPENIKEILDNIKLPDCHYCKKPFKENEFAITIDRANVLYHSECFKCSGCNQNLADNLYYYHKESNNIYCGRDYAKIKGIPRCKACDELIFTKEYCLADNATFHLKHFCCIECDTPLAGQDYTVEDANPYCLPCFEKSKAAKCGSCEKVIKPDEEGCLLKDVHFHTDERCFSCFICRKPLMNQKLLLRYEKLFCSYDCFGKFRV